MNEGDQGPSTADYGGAFDFGYNDSGGGNGMDQAAAEAAMNAALNLSGYGINEGISGLGPSGIGPGKAALDTLSQLGYGSYQGVNPNNPTQSVDEMRAAENVHNFLNYAAPAFAGLIPGYGTISTIGRVGAGLLSGTMTPAQALTAGIAGALGARTGIPGPVFEGILSGDFGRAAGAGVQGGLTSLANNLTGSPLGGLALNLSGIGPAVGKGVSEAVSGGTGGSRSSGLGAALGLSSAPSQGSSPTGNTYGDAGINADTYSVLAAIEQAAQEPKQPEWSSQMTAGRYGPLMDYQFGA
jgi:hypothetical protein